ncbi:MAG: hypothetical protein EA397_02990 [Deltaproteobacteria bacterium]|nr:MAG: hypothetical protein EA397_02990 [Deltaproteobacteria bacterium]
MPEHPQTSTEIAENPPEVDAELQAPWLLYCVFGTPVFLTVLWFFLRFTAPDRFGRVDAEQLEPDHAPPDGTETKSPKTLD